MLAAVVSSPVMVDANAQNGEKPGKKGANPGAICAKLPAIPAGNEGFAPKTTSFNVANMEVRPAIYPGITEKKRGAAHRNQMEGARQNLKHACEIG